MASDSETLVKDWQAVLKQAKEMQLALHKFAANLNLEGDPRSGEPTKDLEFYADQLKDKGDPKDIVVLSELLGRHILPLANLIGDKLRLDVHREAPVLSPEAQAIADGFDRLLDGKTDPRMSYGRIPPQHQIDRNK